MYSFKNDYSVGAHPHILKALSETNDTVQPGYGEDAYSRQAADLIREKLQSPAAGVYFVSGGTQANLTVISSVLKPYQSVISAASGHINHHETGAIEATGHRIEALPAADGKLTPALIGDYLGTAMEVHMRMPKLVYISNSTEVGTHYTKAELAALWEFCREKKLYLFMDGARLASGLDAGDIGFPDLARYTDVFYIGGTKNGALLGEAIVINNPSLDEDFAYNLKMRGALLAKGRILGIQFAELFRDDLYFKIGAHLNRTAARLTEGIRALGFGFSTDSKTNQIFPILPFAVIRELERKYDFYVWEKRDDGKAVVRLVTNWAITDAIVEQFIADLGECAATT
ncbi:amino acid lyase [Dyadobacter beijingensis]|uniref:Amino acid lyase n=1 Tax=Dyadobacter beijingensis TaxID=365489 RepID=A0ABQ2I1C5_9BACT|nr:aminotransferase class V-fold PLP-dependent enzyme [Dyadobacter beijingensis]GGM96785.1 amino acid lyase [Dyadobacter beijingensis]